MTITFKSALSILAIILVTAHPAYPVRLSKNADECVQNAINSVEYGQLAWFKNETTYRQKNTNTKIIKTTIKELAAKRKTFSLKNPCDKSLINNSHLKEALAYLYEETGAIGEMPSASFKTFDTMVHNGAKLAINLFLKHSRPYYNDYLSSLYGIRDLLTFFYVHTIRARNIGLYTTVGSADPVFVITGKYPAFDQFLKEHRRLVKENFFKKRQLFVYRSSPKNKKGGTSYNINLRINKTDYLEPLLGKFRSLRITKGDKETHIELYHGVGDDEELKAMPLDPESCDHPHQLSKKIVSAAEAILDLKTMQHPLTAHALLKKAIACNKAGDFKEDSAQKDFKKFLFTFYTHYLSFYTPEVKKRDGNECRIGPEVFVSAFFRGLHQNKNRDNLINHALQGLFLELIELREKYRQALNKNLAYYDCYQAFQIFADHATILCPYIDEPVVKSYLSQLAIISRYYITNDDKLSLNLIFDSASHDRIKNNMTTRIIAGIINQMCKPLLKKSFEEKPTSTIKKSHLKALKNFNAPFDHSLFSPETGLFVQAKRLERHLGRSAISTPILKLLHYIHLTSQDASELDKKEYVSPFCTKVMNLWDTTVPWIKAVTQTFDLPPLNLGATKETALKKQSSFAEKSSNSTLTTSSISSTSGKGISLLNDSENDSMFDSCSSNENREKGDNYAS